MRLGNYITTLTRPELDELKEYINASDEEIIIIDNLAKRKSLVQIADSLNVSVPTVSRRIRQIETKVRKGGVKWIRY